MPLMNHSDSRNRLIIRNRHWHCALIRLLELDYLMKDNNMELDTTEEIRPSDSVEVYGARVHNLKNIDVTLPHNSLNVITGLSGCGKSSLAFDTIFAEGQRRYIETFSSYARNMLGSLERPDVDKITGLKPVISIEQKTVNKNPRSTIGTTTEVYDFFRLLFARMGRPAATRPASPWCAIHARKSLTLYLNSIQARRYIFSHPS